MNNHLSRFGLLLALGLLTSLTTDLAAAARIQNALTPGFQYNYRGAVRTMITFYKGKPDTRTNINRDQTRATATVVSFPTEKLASTTVVDRAHRTVTRFTPDQKLKIVSTFDASGCEQNTVTYSERGARFESRRCNADSRSVWQFLNYTSDEGSSEFTTITTWSTDGRRAVSTETLRIPELIAIAPSTAIKTEFLFNAHHDLEWSRKTFSNLPGRTTTTNIQYTYDARGNWTSRSEAMRTVNVNVTADNTVYPTLTEERHLTYWQ